jgi:hypothetical protein
LPALEAIRKQLGLRQITLQHNNAKAHVGGWNKHGLDPQKKGKSDFGKEGHESGQLSPLSATVGVTEEGQRDEQA